MRLAPLIGGPLDGHALPVKYERIELESPTPLACMYEDPVLAMAEHDLLVTGYVRYRLLLVQKPSGLHHQPVYLHEGTDEDVLRVGGAQVLPTSHSLDQPVRV